jgi:hypothetical protein
LFIRTLLCCGHSLLFLLCILLRYILYLFFKRRLHVPSSWLLCCLCLGFIQYYTFSHRHVFLYSVILTSAVHILSLVFPVTVISLFPAMFVSFSAPLNLESYKMFAILSILYVFLLAQDSRISSTTTISIIKTKFDLSALWPPTNISFSF